jgi:hypothetical protein
MITLSEKQVWFLVAVVIVLLVIVALAGMIGGGV